MAECNDRLIGRISGFRNLLGLSYGVPFAGIVHK